MNLVRVLLMLSVMLGGPQAVAGDAVLPAEGPRWADLFRSFISERRPTDGWSALDVADQPLAPVLDMSRFLEAPAGRHGFVTRRGGEFVFDDGTPVRFLGVNLMGATALPTHAEAERLASRLAQRGCNLVRIHRIDADWPVSIFDRRYDDTQHLDPEQLDRLDFLCAQLKARGIYIYLDLLVRRVFKAGDGVDDADRLGGGVKGVAQFDAGLMTLQQRYAEQLLTHRNPHTGLRYVDDPAVAFVCLINESSLGQLLDARGPIPRSYRQELEALWSATTNRSPRALWRADDQAVQVFLAELQRFYFADMTQFLRELGLRVPVIGSNIRYGGWDLRTNAELGIVDRHVYWDHPSAFRAPLTFTNQPMLGQPAWNPILKLTQWQVEDVPLLVSEWNACWPNEYRLESSLPLVAYALFQGWDGLLQFHYAGAEWAQPMADSFNIAAQPDLLAQWPLMALMFHRGDVAPARDTLLVGLSESTVKNDHLPPALCYRHRVARRLEDKTLAWRALREFSNEHPAEFRSDTGELLWDATAPRWICDTPRAQAFVGSLSATQALSTRDVTVQSDNSWCVIAVASLDDRPIRISRHLLLMTVGRAENRGSVFDGRGTTLVDSGSGATVQEPVHATLTLAHEEPLGVARVFALDLAGHRLEPVQPEVSAGALTLALRPATAVCYYEIVIGEES